jgi:hypothetical protein
MTAVTPRAKWYRYDDVGLQAFCVAKETPCGVWLDVYCVRRFVLRESRKRFACPTEAEALESYVARKQSQVKILKSQLELAERRLSEAKNGHVGFVIHWDSMREM